MNHRQDHNRMHCKYIKLNNISKEPVEVMFIHLDWFLFFDTTFTKCTSGLKISGN